MVKVIAKIKTEEQYQCGECGMQYAEKEWAEKCEAWCKEHGSCNLEITSHAVPQDEDSVSEATAVKDTKLKNRLFYGSIGLAAALGLFLTFYWHLRLNSSIAALISNTADKPLYFWSYVLLTLGAIVLFGVNASLLVYRWRKFGRPTLKNQAGTGGGSLVGVAAAACPVCGSVLLSAIGITGGLAAFPLGGLELKALSFGLLALPIWLTRRDMKKLECNNDVCPIPQDASFKKEKDQTWLHGALALIVIFLIVGWSMLKTDPVLARFISKDNGIVNIKDNRLNNTNVAATNNPVFDEVAAKVLPENGFQSKIALNDAVLKLVENGVIDRAKFEALYKQNYGSLLPEEIRTIFEEPQREPILLTRENANIYVNLLWPLGLANYMESNKSSPVNGKSLFNFASTGGWNLGKEENGGAYFNKSKIAELTPAQEALVTKIAQNSYRPCCNNSTFFQDCNHGSALLGLLQLGAAQGLTEDELYREALAFNSFWFPQNYIEAALYFKAVKNIDWEDVDPKAVMDKVYSSASGAGLVAQKVSELGLVPQQKSGAGCGV